MGDDVESGVNGEGVEEADAVRPSAGFAVASIPEPALVVDSAGYVVELNGLAVETFECSPAAGFPVSDIVAARPLAAWLAGPRREPLRVRAEARRSDGVPITVELRAAAPAPGADALCLLSELPSDRFGGEAQRYFDGAFDRSPIGMALFDTAGRYTRVNDALCTLLGSSREELIGRRDQEFTHPDDRQSDVDEAWRILRGEIDAAYQHKRFIRPDGEVVWVIACMTFLRDDAGNPLSWVGQFVDVTDAKLLEADLRRLARVDSLTAMANRRALEERIDAALEAGREGALLLVDIDGFKQVNDAGGHATGDRVLCEVGRAIAASIRRDDVAGRWGGDEFAVLIYDSDPRSVKRVSEAIETAVAGLDATPVPISASIGSASFGGGAGAIRDELLAAADDEMYRRKRDRAG